MDDEKCSVGQPCCVEQNPRVVDMVCMDGVPCPRRNYFLMEQYMCDSTFYDDSSPPLSSLVGYVVLLAFGLIFGAFTVGLVYLDRYILGTESTSEQFNTAGRTIKTGLTASVIVSQWTWAATLLQSSNVAYRFGISGPFWYASGATIQIILFAILAILVKLRAPTAHTFLEIIRARWGTIPHIVFTCFAFLTNIIVTSMLILGGSAVVNALTGVNTNVASFLIPLGVIAYTMAGGLKATFVASYFNTAVIMIALVIFSFQVYATADDLGSPGVVWDRLKEVSEVESMLDSEFTTLDTNRDRSYLTIFSLNGLFFGLTNIVGNFGTVFVDQAYWQSAFAATPTASWKGYMLGGMAWFSIPFTLATSLGLAANALSLPITEAEAGQGLVPPATAQHLMGAGGAFLILLMLFMAVTSTGAAEQIAVSSLVAYDIYRTYINPDCSGAMIIKVSRVVIVVFGLVMGVLGILLNLAKINLGWLYLAMGNMIGSAVIPVALAISWKQASGKAAVAGAISGLIAAITVWLTFSYLQPMNGVREISFDSTGRDAQMLAGNLTAILFSGAVTVALSFVWPDNCDWDTTTRAITLVEEDKEAHMTDLQNEELEKALKIISIWGIGLSLVLVLVWPLLTLPAGVFSRGYFTMWVVISLLWGIVAMGAMVLLPLFESKGSIVAGLTLGRVVLWEAAERVQPVDEKEVENPWESGSDSGQVVET